MHFRGAALGIWAPRLLCRKAPVIASGHFEKISEWIPSRVYGIILGMENNMEMPMNEKTSHARRTRKDAPTGVPGLRAFADPSARRVRATGRLCASLHEAGRVAP